MKKRDDKARMIIKQAKTRLLNNDYSEYERSYENVYYINNKKLSKEQLIFLNDTVQEILASDTLVYDALDRLVVDRADFSRLSEPERVKYVFELSKIYASIRSSKIAPDR